MGRGGWRGGGRPRKPESEKIVRFQVSCSPEVKKELDKLITTLNSNRSNYIVDLIRKDLETRKND